VVLFDPDKHHGRILGADEREYFFRESFLDASTISEILTRGVGVEFAVSEHDVRGPKRTKSEFLRGVALMKTRFKMQSTSNIVS
jgi:hypothetical protein